VSCLSNLKQWGLAVQMYSADNNDTLPCDGMSGNNGAYPDGTVSTATGQPTGSPADPFAWFNLLPSYVGDRPLSYYAAQPGGNPLNKFPPFNWSAPPPYVGSGKLWECPSAKMDLATVTGGILQLGGANGFFSYDMNIDLKMNPAFPTGTVKMAYPNMPKITSFKRAAVTVFMFDCVFDPITEVVNGSPGFNSVNPANRQNSIASRHSKGGCLTFLDGHAAYFKTNYIQSGTSPGGKNEPLLPDVIWDAPYRQ
jgi:hypothetical protein